LAAKHKNVDSIAPAVEKVDTESLEAGKPLLSIIEPAGEVRLSFVAQHKKLIVRATGALLLILSFGGLLTGGAYIYAERYKAKIYLGVTVWGEDVGGKSIPEAQKVLTDKIQAYKVTIKAPDQDYVATAEDLGVTYDYEGMITKAFAIGRTDSVFVSNLKRLRLLAGTIDVPFWQKLVKSDQFAVQPVSALAQEKFDQYVVKLSNNIKITAQDSEVKVTAGQVELKPAIYGREVNLELLKSQIRQSIDGFTDEEISVQTTTVKPAIIDTAAQEVMVQAQSVMKRPVVLTYKGVEYRPNQETVSSWITFTKKTGDAKYTLVVDPTKMKGYFDFLGTKINIYPVSRKVRVENGVKQTEVSAGANGTLVDNTQLGRAIAAQLPSQASVTLAIPTYVAPYKTDYERVIIADWDKYIDVNLTTQTMTACERGGVNCVAWGIVSGKNSTPTPVGTWMVMGRNASVNMTDGTYCVDDGNGDDYGRTNGTYCLLRVQWVTWFKGGGYAVHDADNWRQPWMYGNTNFYKLSGSHGCVNAPNGVAKYIYDWAPIGTPVIVHY